MDILVSMIISVLVVVVPVILAVMALYWIIRLGVKHGLRSYDLEKARDSETVI